MIANAHSLRKVTVFSLVVLLTLVAACTSRQSGPRAGGHHMHGDNPAVGSEAELGAVDFQVACDEAVQPDFDRALAMMHHMMYVQARESFEQVAERDPECAMAHWGIATTLFQPLWGTRPDKEDLYRGRTEIERARAIGPGDRREQALVDATGAFFQDPDTADYATREQRWADGMEAAYELNPRDKDTAALYALSRLALAQGEDDPHPLHEEAESILRAIYEQEPQHPGAVHYMIHTDDIDGRAKENLDIVQAYANIAPEIPHPLHMPSHIYVRLGDWPEVIEWNKRSAEAALEHPSGEYVSLHYPHAQDYIVYAHLQRGEDDQARRIMEETFQQGELEPAAASAFHAAALPARMAVETRDWEQAVRLEPRTPGHLPWNDPMGLWAESHTWLARGLGALHTDDMEGAREALERIRTLREDAEDRDEPVFANRIRIDEWILSGWVKKADGEPEDAVGQIQEAVELETRLEKHPITPGSLLPPNEALGNLLMELDRPEEALAAYQKADEIWPGRYHTLLGAARAAKASGADPRPYYEQLLEMTGDTQREGVRKLNK